ncbi:MAG: SHOCT domain-containing protein [Candidatus Nanohaloarchaea archaeon]|nr:SHOCT domain-containing protein [Candidatus Nanohaloarchaea archaeon]
MLEFVAAPFMLGAGFLALLGILLTVYVVYDVLVNQDEMQTAEKLIWIAVVVTFNIFGVIAYLVIVTSQGKLLLDRVSVAEEERRLDELERLNALKDAGALTEDEFREEKERILERDGGS